MNGLPSVEAIVEAIAALPVPARRRLVAEMQRRGYLEAAPPNRLGSPPPPPPTLPTASSTAVVIQGQGEATRDYQLQFGEGPDNLLCATVTGWEECKSFGRDRLEAVENLIYLMGAHAANGDLIALHPTAEGLEDRNSAAKQKLRNYQQVLLYLENVQRQLTATAAAET